MDNNKFYKNILKEINTAPVEKDDVSASTEEKAPGETSEPTAETSDVDYGYDVSEMTQESTFIEKLGTTLSEGHVFGGVVIYFLFIVNLIGTTIFARKASLGVTQSILYKFHIDTISFVDYTFLEVNILIS